MIGQLAQEAVPNATAVMHVHRGDDEDVQDDEFRGEEIFEHGGQGRFATGGALWSYWPWSLVGAFGHCGTWPQKPSQ